MKMVPRLSLFQLSAILVVIALGIFGVGAALRQSEAIFVVAQADTVERALAVVGRARPERLVQIASPSGGEVVRLFYDEGETVQRGAVLAVIRAAVEQAEVEADLSRAAAARAEVREATLAFQRTQTLYDRGFSARAALDADQARLATARANADAAEATARASKARARELVIEAPMDGVVLLRPIDEGQVVAAGETLFDFGSSDPLEIRAEVEEAYADALRVGMRARMAVSGSEQIFSGLLTEVSPQVDVSTGGRLVKVRATEGTPVLSPGRSVDATIVVDVRPGVIALPREAVVDAASAPKVYVLDADDRVAVREVTIDPWPTVRAIILNGVRPGDRVLLSPGDLEAGQKVRPVKGEA
jgi:RND family efflux transporter MFP subunit